MSVEDFEEWLYLSFGPEVGRHHNVSLSTLLIVSRSSLLCSTDETGVRCENRYKVYFIPETFVPVFDPMSGVSEYLREYFLTEFPFFGFDEGPLDEDETDEDTCRVVVFA